MGAYWSVGVSRQQSANEIQHNSLPRYDTFVCVRLRVARFSIIFWAISKPIKGDRLHQNYSATKLFVFRQINNIYIRNIVLFLFFSASSGSWREHEKRAELESENESSIFHMSSDERKSRFREVVVRRFFYSFSTHKPDFNNFWLVNCGVCSTLAHAPWK